MQPVIPPESNQNHCQQSNLRMKPIRQLLFHQTIILQIESQERDPLIDYGAEHVIYIGIFLIFIALAIVIGMISDKLEHALLFSLTLSVVLIAFLWSL